MRRQVQLEEVLDATAFGAAAAHYKIWPGIVTAYHASAAASSPATVDVQPAVHDVRIDTELGARVSEPWPVIPQIPLGMPQGGGYAMRFPMAAGDKVVLLSFDLDPTAHRGTGQKADPVDTRRHGGGYWIALPFDITDPGALPDPGNALVIGQPGGVQVRISPSGVDLGAAAPADAIALASKVDANTAALKTFADAVNTIVGGLVVASGVTGAQVAAFAAAETAFKAALAASGSSTVKATP